MCLRVQKFGWIIPLLCKNTIFSLLQSVMSLEMPLGFNWLKIITIAFSSSIIHSENSEWAMSSKQGQYWHHSNRIITATVALSQWDVALDSMKCFLSSFLKEIYFWPISWTIELLSKWWYIFLKDFFVYSQFVCLCVFLFVFVGM